MKTETAIAILENKETTAFGTEVLQMLKRLHYLEELARVQHSQAYDRTRKKAVDGVKIQHSGFADPEFSARHREWEVCCNAHDIDSLIIESNETQRPSALVEYKHYSRDPQKRRYFVFPPPSSMTAAKYLADNSGIPLFLVMYQPDDDYAMIVHFYNSYAALFATNGKFDAIPAAMMTERMYVKMMHDVRNNGVPPKLLETRGTIMPNGEPNESSEWRNCISYPE